MIDKRGFTVNASVTSSYDKIAAVFIMPVNSRKPDGNLEGSGGMTIQVPGQNSTYVAAGPGQFYVMVQCYAPDCNWTVQIP